jgi:hypothetical protein
MPRFQRLQRVLVASGRLGGRFVGQQGTVIWCDRPCFDRRTVSWSEWIYSLSLPELGCYQAFLETNLQPTGEFDTEESQFGSRYEISYDTEFDGEESGTVEGSYRLPGRPWQVFLFEHGDVPEIRHSFGTWRSGITGIELVVPRSTPINCDCITRAMSEVFGTDAWAVVRGPDSIYLK